MRGANIPHKPVLVALAVGTVLVVLALVVGRSETVEESGGQVAVVTRAPERTYVPVEDSNGNEIPDWQEALVRTEPLQEVTNSSSSDWRPQTLTETFSIEFFENFMRNKTFGDLGRDQESFVAASAEALAEKAEDKKATPLDIRVSDSTDPEALKRYGNELAALMNKYPGAEESEMIILERALRDNNPQELLKLEPIINSYRGMIVDMKLIEVPSTYVQEHLALLNMFLSVTNDIYGASLAFKDPMYSLVRTKRYQADVQGMGEAILAIFNKLVVQDKIRFGPGDELYTLLPRDL